MAYLFEGAMLHRDSTSVVQHFERGAIKWMAAALDTMHAERTPDDLRGRVRRSHGLQPEAPLQLAGENIQKSFARTPAPAILALEVAGATVRVLVGAAFGRRSPVLVHRPTLYLDIARRPDSTRALP